MIVMKFGGMSIVEGTSIRRVIDIIRGYLPARPIVVISAMGKTTRHLLEIASRSASGDAEEAEERLNKIREAHLQILHDLFPFWEDSESWSRIMAYDRELHRLLHGMAVLRDLTPRSLDKFLAYGELMATSILSEALTRAGIDAVWTDARTYMRTDDRFGAARPLEAAAEGIRRALIPLVEAKKVPVVQGYIGATEEGATTTLGFEGSDLTATFVGAAVGAREIQIWKNVPGLMTADPAVFPHAWTVKTLSYDTAAELTLFGAKVLHPRAVAPARQQGIPIHIRNTLQPEATGTRIVASPPACKNQILSITYKRGMGRLTVCSPDVGSTNEVMRYLADALDREGIHPFFTTTAAGRFTLAVESNGSLRSLIHEMSRRAEVSWEEGKATVSLVGERDQEAYGVASEVLRVLKGLPVHMLVHRVSPILIGLLLDEDGVEEAIARLHDYFFMDPDPACFEV